MEAIQQEILGLVQQRVREGFESCAAIVAGVTELIEDEHKGTWIRAFVEQATRAALAQQAQEQAQWATPTDCDRLDLAFGQLEAQGIVARQNFTCCQTCGHGEIIDEIKELSKVRPVVGYVFYHQQDTERAAEDGSLFLAYGAYHAAPPSKKGNFWQETLGQLISLSSDPDAPSDTEIGWKIVAALWDQGLQVQWDGSVSKRILIEPLNWQRRRVAP